MSFINVDIHGFSPLRSDKGVANMLRTPVLLEKYNTNIDDIWLKRRNLEPKKWSLFDIF